MRISRWLVTLILYHYLLMRTYQKIAMDVLIENVDPDALKAHSKV